MRDVFPIWLINDVFWPVTEYSYTKHHIDYLTVNLNNIGLNMHFPKHDKISDMVNMTFIEDHTRSIEAAVGRWIQSYGYPQSIYNATPAHYGAVSNDQTRLSVTATISTFDATRSNVVKVEKLELMPPNNDFTISGSADSDKGSIKYQLTFPLVSYRCEYLREPIGYKKYVNKDK